MGWTIEALPAGTLNAQEPRLGFDASGNAHVFYSVAGTWPYRTIWHIQRTDGAWDSPESIVTINYQYDYWGAAIYGDDMCVAYSARDGSDVILHTATATVGGSWTDVEYYRWPNEIDVFPWYQHPFCEGLDVTVSGGPYIGIIISGDIWEPFPDNYGVLVFANSSTPTKMADYNGDNTIERRNMCTDPAGGVHLVFGDGTDVEYATSSGGFSPSAIWPGSPKGIATDAANAPAFLIDTYFATLSAEMAMPHTADIGVIADGPMVFSGDTVSWLRGGTWRDEVVHSHDFLGSDAIQNRVMGQPWLCWYDVDDAVLKVAWPGLLSYVTWF